MNRGDHKITRSSLNAERSFLSYLPSSTKYIFTGMMVVGVLVIIYMIFMSSSYHTTKFKNKGKLMTYLQKQLTDNYDDKIESSLVDKNFTLETFNSRIMYHGLPYYLKFAEDLNSTSAKTEQKVKEIMAKVKQMTETKPVNATLIS
jgi:hypothetical protein